MSYPKISKTGTAPEELIKQALDVKEAAVALIATLEAAAPKTGDYTQTPSAFFKARETHNQRILVVKNIITHVDCLAAHVADQFDTEAA